MPEPYLEDPFKAMATQTRLWYKGSGVGLTASPSQMLLETIYAICLAIAILVAFLYKHSSLEHHVSAWLDGRKKLVKLTVDHRTLVITGLLVQNLVILFYGVEFDKGAIGRRSARAATLHILPCLIFAARNSPIAFMLQVSHLELHYVHSCYGCLILANTAIHFCFLPSKGHRRRHIGLVSPAP